VNNDILTRILVNPIENTSAACLAPGKTYEKITDKRIQRCTVVTEESQIISLTNPWSWAALLVIGNGKVEDSVVGEIHLCTIE
jgi:hypothetical protein